MTTPTVGRFLPGDVPASPAQHRARRQFLRETERLVEAATVDRCQWVEGVCVTRKSLHRAVVEVTRQPPGDLRDAAFAVANAAYEAHVERCKRPVEVREPESGVGVTSRLHPTSAGPSLLDVGERHHAAVEAAMALVDAREFAGTDTHANALTAFVEADRAFWRALYDLTPNLRHPHASV